MEESAKIALKTVTDELKKSPEIELVRFVLYDVKALEVHEKALESMMSIKNSAVLLFPSF